MNLTPTAKELSNSKEFWKQRIREQDEHITRYRNTPHTRPDHQMVLETAEFIRRRCEEYALKLG